VVSCVVLLVWVTTVASIAIVASKGSSDSNFEQAMLLNILQPEAGSAGRHVPEELAEASLDPASLYNLDISIIKERFHALKSKYSSKDKLGHFIIPDDTWVLARLFSSANELAGYDTTAKNNFGRFYTTILEAIDIVKEQAYGIEVLLTLYYGEFVKPAKTKRYAQPVAHGKYSLPTKQSLKYSHPDALDIFYTQVRNKDKNEIGPEVISISQGIVISALGDWKGGDTPASYVSGGLSPRAGNGVVIFSPLEQRYYCYFHLHDVSVVKGQFVEAGQKLGRGGNSGINAKKPGHGGHLHLEIHETSSGQWSSTKLYDFIRTLR
jgi:hypothetical protein